MSLDNIRDAAHLEVGLSGSDAKELAVALDTARAEAAALRAGRDHLNSVLERMHAHRDEAWAERDAAIARAEKAEAEAHSMGTQSACWSTRCLEAERARDEVGIQLAAAQGALSMTERERDKLKAAAESAINLCPMECTRESYCGRCGVLFDAMPFVRDA
jgi:chromosome segregation ATPase